MSWAILEHSKGEVDRAGAILVNPSATHEEKETAFQIINNWRSCHNFPLNTLQMGLRQKAAHVNIETLVSQRIKRLSSIHAKLARLSTMKLSQMQDIGGCRAVLPNARHVSHLVKDYRNSSMKHLLARTDDYIATPRISGYRSVHLIYRYFSDRKTTYNGLSIEVQIRSQLQHAWATAVETVGTFLKQALKSSQGEQDWLRFFALMGSALALKEKTPLVPGTPTKDVELIREIRRLGKRLDVIKRLTGYGRALKTIETTAGKAAHYFLLALNPVANELVISPYSFADLERATSDYLRIEREYSQIPAADAVLVSVESVSSLRKAYPNYFLDTKLFVKAVTETMS